MLESQFVLIKIFFFFFTKTINVSALVSNQLIQFNLRYHNSKVFFCSFLGRIEGTKKTNCEFLCHFEKKCFIQLRDFDKQQVNTLFVRWNSINPQQLLLEPWSLKTAELAGYWVVTARYFTYLLYYPHPSLYILQGSYLGNFFFHIFLDKESA